MNVDSMLTIVLPVKDRMLLTCRWMNYANRISLPFRVLVADGGRDGRVSDRLANPAHFPAVTYEYVGYPYDQSYSEFSAKMADALARVDTPYVAIADDACLYIVDGLRHAVEFLCSHPDYNICGGNIGCFSLAPFEQDDHIVRAYSDESRFFSGMYRMRDLADETAGVRVRNHFMYYAPTYYDVHRTDQLTSCFKAVREANFKDLFLLELLASFLAVCAGKVKKESYLYMLRQLNHRSSSAGEHRKNYGDCLDRMLSASWSDDFAQFVGAIASAICEQDGVSVDVAQRQVREGYRLHLGPLIAESLSREDKPGKRGVVGRMKGWARRLPYDGLMRRALEKLYSDVRTRGDQRPHASRPMPIRWSSEFYEDVKSLREFLSHPLE